MDEVKRNEVKETIASIIKSLECVICLDILDDPVSTGCHHYFCRNCIKKVLSRNYRAPCPLCKNSFTKRSLQERSQLVLITSCAKNLAEAYKKDTGLEVSPPKGPRISAASPASRDWKEKLFDICHPSPLKPLNKNKTISKKAPEVLSKRRKKQLPKKEKFSRLETASEDPLEKTPSTKAQATNENELPHPAACPGSSHAAEFCSRTDPSTSHIPVIPTSNSKNAINQKFVESTEKENSSVHEVKTKCHTKVLPGNPQAQEDSDSDVETVAKIEKFLQSSLRETENNNVSIEQDADVNDVNSKDTDSPVTSTPDVHVRNTVTGPRMEVLTNGLSPVKIQDSSVLTNGLSPIKIQDSSMLTCHSEGKHIVDTEMPQLQCQVIPPEEEKKFRYLEFSKENEIASERDPYVFVPSQKSTQKKPKSQKQKKASKIISRHVSNHSQKVLLSGYTKKVLQSNKTSETDHEKDPYVFVSSQKSPLKMKIRRRIIERIRKVQLAKMKSSKKCYDKKTENLYATNRRQPCFPPEPQEMLLAENAINLVDDHDISLFVTPAFSVEDLPTAKPLSPKRKRARFKWCKKRSMEKERKSRSAASDRLHNDEASMLNVKIAEAESYELEVLQNCDRSLIQDKYGEASIAQTDTKTASEAVQADKINVMKMKSGKTPSNNALIKDGGGRNNHIPKNNHKEDWVLAQRRSSMSEDHTLPVKLSNIGKGGDEYLKAHLGTSTKIRLKEASFNAVATSQCVFLTKDLASAVRYVATGMNPKKSIDLSKNPSKTHYIPSQTSLSVFGSSEAKWKGDIAGKTVESDRGLHFGKRVYSSSMSEIAETLAFSKPTENHVSKDKRVNCVNVGQKLIPSGSGKQGNSDVVSSKVDETPMSTAVAPTPIHAEGNVNNVGRNEDLLERIVAVQPNSSRLEQSYLPHITGGNGDVIFSSKLSPEKPVCNSSERGFEPLSSEVEETLVCPKRTVKLNVNRNFSPPIKEMRATIDKKFGTASAIVARLIPNQTSAVVEDKPSSEEFCLEEVEKFFKKPTRKTFALDVESQDLEDLTGDKSHNTLDMLDNLYSAQNEHSNIKNKNDNWCTSEISNDTPLEVSNNSNMSDGTLLVSTREGNFSCETPLNFAQNCLPTPDTSIRKDTADQTSEVNSSLLEKTKVAKRVCLTLEEIHSYFEKSDQSKKAEVICVIPSPSDEFRIELSVADQTFNVSVLKVTNSNKSTPSSIKTSRPVSRSSLPSSSFLQRLNEAVEACIPSKISTENMSKHVTPVPMKLSGEHFVSSCPGPKACSETSGVTAHEKSNGPNSEKHKVDVSEECTQSNILENCIDISDPVLSATETTLPQISTQNVCFSSHNAVDNFLKDGNTVQVANPSLQDKIQSAKGQDEKHILLEKTDGNNKETVPDLDTAFENADGPQSVQGITAEIQETLSLPDLCTLSLPDLCNKEGRLQDSKQGDFHGISKNDVWVKTCADTFEALEFESKLRKSEDRDTNVLIDSDLVNCSNLNEDSSSSDAFDPCIYRPKSLNAAQITLAEPMKESESFSSDPDMIFAESLVAPLKEIAEKMGESRHIDSGNKSIVYNNSGSSSKASLIQKQKKSSSNHSSARKHGLSGRQSKLEEMFTASRKSQSSVRNSFANVSNAPVSGNKASRSTSHNGRMYKRIKNVAESDDSDDEYSLSLFDRVKLRQQTGNTPSKSKEVPVSESHVQCVEPDSQTDPTMLKNTESLGLTNDVSSSCHWTSEDLPSSQARGKMKMEIEEMKERIKMMEQQINKSVTDDHVDGQENEGASTNEEKSSAKVRCKDQNAQCASKRPYESSSEDSDDLFTPPVSPTPPKKTETRTIRFVQN